MLVSGRPLDVTDELPSRDALVQAWLPGSEGAGVADVLFGAHDPTGKLPFTWPRRAAQQPINAGDGQTPLFRLDAGRRQGLVNPNWFQFGHDPITPTGSGDER